MPSLTSVEVERLPRRSIVVEPLFLKVVVQLVAELHHTQIRDAVQGHATGHMILVGLGRSGRH